MDAPLPVEILKALLLAWAQIFASGSCFQIPLAWIPPLMFQNHIAQLAILL